MYRGKEVVHLFLFNEMRDLDKVWWDETTTKDKLSINFNPPKISFNKLDR